MESTSMPGDRLFIGLFIAVTTSFLLVAALLLPAARFGDGHEYALMAEALDAHGTPSVQRSDIERLLQLDSRSPQGDYRVLTEEAKRGLEGGYPTVGMVPRGDHLLASHFWAYPALAVPAKRALRWIGADELKLFQVTNALVVALAVAWVMLLAPWPASVRAHVAVFVVLGGAVFYLRWSDPLLLSAAALVMASVQYLRRKPGSAALLTAIAALQNPSAAALGIFLIPGFYAAIRDGIVERRWRSLVATLLGGFVALLLVVAPFAWSKWAFGAINPVSAFIDAGLIGPARLSSFLLDLDQGLLVGAPGLLLAVVLTLFVRSPETPRRTLALLAAWFLILLPTLAQVNWNAGQTVFLRYACWTAAPLIVWLGARNALLSPASRMVTLSIPLALQVAMVVAYGGLHPRDNYLDAKPWSRWLDLAAPALRRPDPEIFVERGIHQERDPRQLPAFGRADADGVFRRVYLPPPDSAVAEKDICPGGFRLQSIDDGSVLERQAGRATYRTGSFACHAAPSGQVAFSDRALDSWLVDGFSHAESWGRWSNADSASLRLRIDPRNAAAVRVALLIRAYEGVGEVPVTASVRGRTVARWMVRPGDPAWQELQVPADDLSESGLEVRLRYEIDFAAARRAQTPDRTIAVAFHELRWQVVPAAGVARKD